MTKNHNTLAIDSRVKIIYALADLHVGSYYLPCRAGRVLAQIIYHANQLVSSETMSICMPCTILSLGIGADQAVSDSEDCDLWLLKKWLQCRWYAIGIVICTTTTVITSILHNSNATIYISQHWKYVILGTKPNNLIYYTYKQSPRVTDEQGLVTNRHPYKNIGRLFLHGQHRCTKYLIYSLLTKYHNM